MSKTKVDIDKLIGEYYESDIHQYYSKYGDRLSNKYMNWGLRIKDNHDWSVGGGYTTFEQKKGYHKFSKKQKSDFGKVGGSISGPVNGRKLKEKNRGIFGIPREEHLQNCKEGGISCYSQGKGIASLTKEQRQELGRRVGNITAERTRIAIIAYDKKTKEFIGEFKSMTEAAKKLNCFKTHISACCNGKAKSHKGYIFEYKS
jgi:hypothetical protein